MNYLVKLAALFGVMWLCAFAYEAPLPDAAQEARAQNLFRQMRCVVCQGQPLSETNASLAYDMRQVIRQQIADGKTDDAIFSYFTERYGDEIATTPPVTGGTFLLWGAPFLLLAVAVMVMVLRNHQRLRSSVNHRGDTHR